MNKQRSRMFRPRLIAVTALLLVLWCGMGRPTAQAASDAGNGLKSIEVKFKFDPGSTYGGPQWHPAPFTSPVQGGQAIVEAKVEGIDLEGKLAAVNPQWTVEDGAMVIVSAVSPGRLDRVRITVTRAGESKVKVSAQQVCAELLVEGKSLVGGKALQVRISILNTGNAPASAVQQDVVPANSPQVGLGSFKTQKEKESYALGMRVAEKLRSHEIEVDQHALEQGYEDAVSGKTLLTARDARAIVALLREEGRKNREAQRAGGNQDSAAQNKQAGEAFLAENKTLEGVVTLPSGLQYKVLKLGEGRKPGLKDTVVCSYRGTLLDGSEFDSSYKRRKPARFAVAAVIPGWIEALQLMPVGSKWQLFIPSHLAYGEHPPGRSKIGPNATLIFEVELISIENASGSLPAQASKEDLITADRKP